MATGPGIAPGHINRTLSIMDLAPTFCALLGVTLEDVDGQAITEVTRAATSVDALAI